jgi:hypothetical protein
MSHEDPLTSAERDLEAALRSLRPAPAQVDVAAAADAASHRAPSQRLPRRRLRLWHIAAAAAVVVVAGAWLKFSDPQHWPHFIHSHLKQVEKTLIAIRDPRASEARTAPVAPPTLMSYRQALTQSPAELDALLARQSATGAAPQRSRAPAADVLTLWNANLNSQTGEM